jgi:hypothetical protein
VREARGEGVEGPYGYRLCLVVDPRGEACPPVESLLPVRLFTVCTSAVISL